MDEGDKASTSRDASAEWQGRVVDTIEDVVGSVHDRVVRPLTVVARGVVFGIIVGVMGLVLAVVTVIALIRLLDVYAFRGRVWAADAVIGALFVTAGAVLWSRRGPRRVEDR